MLGELREFMVGGDMDQRERFVVTQQHVKARQQALLKFRADMAASAANNAIAGASSIRS